MNEVDSRQYLTTGGGSRSELGVETFFGGGAQSFFPTSGASPSSGKGLGSLLGNVGIPFGGLVGDVLGGFFGSGKSSVTDFTRNAVKFVDEIVPSYIADSGQDLSSLLTLLSREFAYMKAYYDFFLEDSSSSHSIEGNRQGVEIIKKGKTQFDKMVNDLKTSYTLSSTRKNGSSSYGQAYINGIKHINANLSFSYKEFRAVAKTGSNQVETVIIDGVPVQVPVKNKPLNLLWFLLALPVGLVFWLLNKKK